LIELLIVVAIIGILSAILIPNLLSARERGRRANSEGGIKAIASASEQFAVDVGVYPANKAGLELLDPGGQAYLRNANTVLDGWGVAYNLAGATDRVGRQAGAPYTGWNVIIISSFGRDRAAAAATAGFDSDIYACMPGGQVQIAVLQSSLAVSPLCPL